MAKKISSKSKYKTGKKNSVDSLDHVEKQGATKDDRKTAEKLADLFVSTEKKKRHIVRNTFFF